MYILYILYSSFYHFYFSKSIISICISIIINVTKEFPKQPKKKLNLKISSHTKTQQKPKRLNVQMHYRKCYFLALKLLSANQQLATKSKCLLSEHWLGKQNCRGPVLSPGTAQWKTTDWLTSNPSQTQHDLQLQLPRSHWCHAD